MRRTARLLAALAAALLAGCYGQVQRTITIDSEPEGARCWLNDNEVGLTPVTVPFTWYGTYRVRLEKPGYEPLEAEAPVRAPWFQWIPFDLAFETVVPGTHSDAHAFRYRLTEARPTDPAALRQRAEAMRRGARLPEFQPVMKPTGAPSAEGEPAPTAPSGAARPMEKKAPAPQKPSVPSPKG